MSDNVLNVGNKVTSQIYKDSGIGTIIGFSGFEDEFIEVFFETGKKIVCRAMDLQIVTDPVSALKNSEISDPDSFICRFISLVLQGSLTEKSLISSLNYKIKPLPHQLLAVDFVMNRFKPRCLIADEVGLGKTIEAILVYQEYRLRGMAKRTIIIAPSGLVLQWHEELVSKFDETFVIYNTEYVKNLKQSYGENTNVWKLNDKIIVSMDTIKPLKVNNSFLSEKEINRRNWHNKNMYEDLINAGFDIVIIDEAHKLSKKNDQAESLRFKLAKKLSSVVPVFILLTATPHQGDEDLFFHLLKLVDPVLFSDKSFLKPELVKEVCVRNKKRAVVDFSGKRIFKHRITSTRSINRTKNDNGDELFLYELVTNYVSTCYNMAVNKNNQFLIMLVMLFQRIASSSSFAIEKSMKKRKYFLEKFSLENEAELNNGISEDPEEDDIFSKTASVSTEDIENEIKIVDECIKAAENVSSSFKDKKFKVLVELIEEIIIREDNPDQKFLIFTEFRPTQDAIISYLENFGYSCAFINGSLSREGKNEQVGLFRDEKQIMVSTDAGGEGINLQFCNCIINFDLPWNPSRLEQRIGRIDRIGQNKNSFIFNFRLTDTIEDRVREILETKLELIKDQFGDDKYADVLDVLEDEFSFDKIYIDAVNAREKESHELDIYASKIFNRAKDVLEKGDLLIPFSESDEKKAEKLINNSSYLIKEMVFSFLRQKKITINEYKSKNGLFHFKNPFSGNEYKHLTFDPEISFESEKYDLVNLEHFFFKKINEFIKKSDSFGRVSAIKLDINKFSGIKGYWFVFILTITNNIDKKYSTPVSVFMEDEDFNNYRISLYLNKGNLNNCTIVQNFKCKDQIDLIYKSAFSHAKEKGEEIYLAKKIEWIEEIENYEEKAKQYFEHRQKLIDQIKVENIREARFRKNNEQRAKEVELLERKKIIVPDLKLEQVAFVEFI
ncbi:MAG: helicase-related protein [Desulforegulaceae bacterium]|nr:helicase-related protein [Desulforegulaceae bacterium]